MFLNLKCLNLKCLSFLQWTLTSPNSDIKGLQNDCGPCNDKSTWPPIMSLSWQTPLTDQFLAANFSGQLQSCQLRWSSLTDYYGNSLLLSPILFICHFKSKETEQKSRWSDCIAKESGGCIWNTLFLGITWLMQLWQHRSCNSLNETCRKE